MHCTVQCTVHSEMFALVTTAHLCSPFDSLGQKSDLTGTTDLFSCSVKAQGCHGLGSSLMNRAERKMGSRRNRCREKYLLSSTIPQKGMKNHKIWREKKTNINTVLLKIDWY